MVLSNRRIEMSEKTQSIKKHEINMLEGSLWDKIHSFGLPGQHGGDRGFSCRCRVDFKTIGKESVNRLKTESAEQF